MRDCHVELHESSISKGMLTYTSAPSCWPFIYVFGSDTGGNFDRYSKGKEQVDSYLQGGEQVDNWKRVVR